MPIDETKLNALLELSRTAKPQVCEVLKVDWSNSVTRYYAVSAFDKIPPFTDIKTHLGGGTVDARLMQAGFHSFELNADLTTEEISLTFADSDEAIKNLFQTYGGGIKAELIYYYPQVDLFYGVWWGVLNAPTEAGRGALQVSASNGFKSRELLMPRRLRPENCTAIFGGELPDIDDFRGNGCRYNRHLGGSIGNLDAGGDPFTSCPKDITACAARGMTNYFMGFNTGAPAVITDPHNPNYLPKTTGNADRLTEPIRVIFGIKNIRDLPNLTFRNENTAAHPEQSWVRGVWEIGEGPVKSIDNVKVSLGSDAAADPRYLQVRLGDYAQALTNYGGAANFSGTALIYHLLGYVPANTPASSVTTRCRVQGYAKVRNYSDADTYGEQWENNRVWCLMELYTNLRFGRGYSHSKFWIEDFIAAADKTEEYVRFTATRADGSTVDYDHYRTKFDAILEARPTQEVIMDICRAGRLSVPFQYEGKYSIATLTEWEDLESCRVFSDKGTNRNIDWKEGLHSIGISQIPDSQLPNHIVVVYEDGSKTDKEVTLTVEDEEQKKKAGKAWGSPSIDVPKKYAGFGIRVRAEAVKFASSLLSLGDLDSGGIVNNLRLEFDVIFEQALGLKKFDVIKVESDLLSGYGFDYFRVMKMRKGSNHHVTITAQAYPQDYYETFEPVLPLPEDPPVDGPPGGGGEVCRTTLGTITYGDNNMNIPVNPC